MVFYFILFLKLAALGDSLLAPHGLTRAFSVRHPDGTKLKSLFLLCGSRPGDHPARVSDAHVQNKTFILVTSSRNICIKKIG